jgi:hypothetical protein
MKKFVLLIILGISNIQLWSQINGLDGYVKTYSYSDHKDGGRNEQDVDSYIYEFVGDQIPAREEIGMVITEMKRVLELNGRTLDSYDALIPEYNVFNSFNSEDILNEMMASFHIGFRYIIGEYSIYMYATDYDKGDYSVGFMVEKTSEY